MKHPTCKSCGVEAYPTAYSDFKGGFLCVRCHSAFDRDKRGVRKSLFESNGIGIRKTGKIAQKVL